MSGSGSFVDVPEGVVDGVTAGWVNGRNLLLEKFEQQEDLVSTMKSEALGALDVMDSLVGDSSLPDNWSDELDNLSFSPIVPLDIATSGSRPVINLSDIDWPVIFPVMGEMKETPNPDLGYDTPVKPDAPTVDFSYEEEAYQSVIWEPLYQAVYDGLTTDGPILSEAIQQQIMDQAEARDKTTFDEAYQSAITATGPDGFDLAGGNQAAVISRVINQKHEAKNALSRDIAIKMAELSDLNRKFQVDKGIAVEQIIRAYEDGKRNRSLESEKLLADFILRKYSELMRAYTTEWDAIRVKLETEIKSVELVLTQNRTTIDTFLGQMEGNKIQAEVGKAIVDGEVSAYQGEVDGFKAEIDEKIAVWAALTDEQKSKIEFDDLRLRKAIGKVTALVEGYLAADKLKAEISNDKASILAQIISSALASTHSGINHSTQKGESLSESISNAASLVSSHTFDETKTS